MYEFVNLMQWAEDLLQKKDPMALRAIKFLDMTEQDMLSVENRRAVKMVIIDELNDRIYYDNDR